MQIFPFYNPPERHLVTHLRSCCNFAGASLGKKYNQQLSRSTLGLLSTQLIAMSQVPPPTLECHLWGAVTNAEALVKAEQIAETEKSSALSG
jgi:hypothetical protein